MPIWKPFMVEMAVSAASAESKLTNPKPFDSPVRLSMYTCEEAEAAGEMWLGCPVKPHSECHKKTAAMTDLGTDNISEVAGAEEGRKIRVRDVVGQVVDEKVGPGWAFHRPLLSVRVGEIVLGGRAIVGRALGAMLVLVVTRRLGMRIIKTWSPPELGTPRLVFEVEHAR